MNRQELKAALAPFKTEYGIDFRISNERLQTYYDIAVRDGKITGKGDDTSEGSGVKPQPGIGISIPAASIWVIWLTLDYPLTVKRTRQEFTAFDRYGQIFTEPYKLSGSPGAYRKAVVEFVLSAARQHSHKFDIKQAVKNWEDPTKDLYLGPMIQQSLQKVSSSYRLKTTESILGTVSLKALEYAPDEITADDWGEYTGVTSPSLALGRARQVDDFYYQIRITPTLNYRIQRTGVGGPWLIWQHQDNDPGMFTGFSWNLDDALKTARTQGSLWVAANGSLFENALVALFGSGPASDLLMLNVDVVETGRNAGEMPPITDIFDPGDVYLLPSEIDELHPKGVSKGIIIPVSYNLAFRVTSRGEKYSLDVETVAGVECVQLYDNFSDAFDRAVFEMGKALAMMRDRNQETWTRYLAYAKQSGSFHAVAAVCVAFG